MRPLNYERYRILVQNGFLKIKEEKFLKTIALEEKYGGKTYQQQKAEDDKKKVEKSKVWQIPNKILFTLPRNKNES